MNLQLYCSFKVIFIHAVKSKSGIGKYFLKREFFYAFFLQQAPFSQSSLKYFYQNFSIFHIFGILRKLSLSSCFKGRSRDMRIFFNFPAFFLSFGNTLFKKIIYFFLRYYTSIKMYSVTAFLLLQRITYSIVPSTIWPIFFQFLIFSWPTSQAFRQGKWHKGKIWKIYVAANAQNKYNLLNHQEKQGKTYE